MATTMPDNFSPSLTDLARRSFTLPDLPPQLHDALAAVRQRGAYYGGAPQVPGPAIGSSLSQIARQAEPAAIGWNSAQPFLRRGPSPSGANENTAAARFRFFGDDRLGVLNKLIANRDFRPAVHRGKLYFRSLSPQENEIMQRIGWARAPDVEYEQEMSDDPLTSLRAWERNITHWHELASPPQE
jgi:hypothetical protein